MVGFGHALSYSIQLTTEAFLLATQQRASELIGRNRKTWSRYPARNRFDRLQKALCNLQLLIQLLVLVVDRNVFNILPISAGY